MRGRIFDIIDEINCLEAVPLSVCYFNANNYFRLEGGVLGNALNDGKKFTQINPHSNSL